MELAEGEGLVENGVKDVGVAGAVLEGPANNGTEDGDGLGDD